MTALFDVVHTFNLCSTLYLFPCTFLFDTKFNDLICRSCKEKSEGLVSE